ncbi:MAG: biotin--[acetyl-CoA-carboxylase] ligase [Proteobacteria bacterium]|nr:biotin--[acetyl-CoA-carboxylase] ligase [Pseudomonadota bacterium]
MSETPQHWGVPALWQQLSPLLPGLSIEVVERVGSTNTVLLERARPGGRMPREAGDAARPSASGSGSGSATENPAFGRRAIDFQPCLLVAEQQVNGRGRQGRTWHSAPGSSLTFSLGLLLQPPDWAGLSLAVGVALAEALAGSARPPRVGVKWPNDLWLMDAPGQGRKLAGILIETVQAGSSRLAAIGIGINVRPLPTLDASQGVACLAEVEPDVQPSAVLARIALPLVQALRTFESRGFEAFEARYAAFDVLADRPVRTTRGDALEGVARGVAADGSLRVETAAGVVHLTSGEVGVRPHAGSDRSS